MNKDVSEAQVIVEIPGYWRFEECGTVEASGASSIERLWVLHKAFGMEIPRPNGVLIRTMYREFWTWS